MASRTRPETDTSRTGPSSPYDEDVFTTAGSFKDIIHSTPQRDMSASQSELPLHYDQYPDPPDHHSDASSEMSIEMGRGIKRGANQDYRDDISSHAIFSFGNDYSQHEITGTPPVRPRASQRKSESGLRKEASVRRATESAKVGDAGKSIVAGGKQRAVSDNMSRYNTHSETREPSIQTATITVRGARFAGSRHISRNYTGIPSRFTVNGGLEAADNAPSRADAANPTVQSANHSFMIPDMPDLTELFAGPRKDEIPPVAKRAHRSRFTSASYRPQTQAQPQRIEIHTHVPLGEVPIAESDKAIFASLQLMHDRVAQLESEKSDYQKRVEESENKIIELRGQLLLASRRAGSASVSDEDSSNARNLREDKVRLQGKVKALEERLNKAERRTNIAEITTDRITRERDAIFTRISMVTFENEELLKENEQLRESEGKLEAEGNDLEVEVVHLKKENAMLRQRLEWLESSQRLDLGKKRPSYRADGAADDLELDNPTEEPPQPPRQAAGGLRSKKEGRSKAVETNEGTLPRQTSRERVAEVSARDIASRIEREVQKHREKAAAQASETQKGREEITRSASLRARSRSAHRKEPRQDDRDVQKRHSFTNVNAGTTRTESASSRSRGLSRDVEAAIPAFGQVRDDQEVTLLSDIDPEEFANLRRKLEKERWEGRRKVQDAAATADETEPTNHSATKPPLPRKSSLRDITAGLIDGTGRLNIQDQPDGGNTQTGKTVRVMSPHSSFNVIELEIPETEIGDASTLSNISRRRRRAESMEGMTSAFILPDITMHDIQQQGTDSTKSCIHHKAASCTVCAPQAQEVKIPTPVPVTDRESMADVTDATIRPAQPPALALATVIKHLEDEVTHLKISLKHQNGLYRQHNPALSKRRRVAVKDKIASLTAQIERKSDQVYALYDVLEGQKQGDVRDMDEEKVEETLNSIGIDPVELSGRVGRKAPEGLEGLSGDESDELPWEGLSEVESDGEIQGIGR